MMKKTNYGMVMVLFLLFFQPTYAQNEKNKLTGLLEDLRKAMQDPDQKKLDELISDQLTYGHSNGMLDTKESFISNMVSGKANFDDLEFSSIVVIDQPHTAIIRHVLKARSLDAGKEPSMAHLNVMLVWTREKGTWKLIGRQAVKVQ